MIKAYLMGLADLALLAVPFLNLDVLLPFLVEVNEVIKFVAGVGGLVLLYFTIRKIRQDLALGALRKKKEEEELRQLENRDF